MTGGCKRANKPPWWRILRARLYFARKTREWPWNVPWQVVYIEKPNDRDLERGEELAKEHGWE